ncbi:LysR substrate-binding domain-containing protein [Methylopila sp. M107]|uniref:LysR substrate-binding domain-containing protein n=1 Tax=Methylopila sp. M107 TaxID=1101190 RepID=UPI0003616C87|nr:LysR substrate-binding domain-containing protein [Methylopila sp. M107]
MDEFSSSQTDGRRLPPLGALRAFEAAGRRLSFQRAAEELGVTPTAISHQIRQLEEQLGLSLFERKPRKVALTEAGLALLPALTRGFDEMSTAIDALRRKPVRKVATLSATVAFTAKLLAPRAARFRELNPGWDLRLHASDDPVDLAGGEADAAIRYGLGSGGGLTRRPLMTDRFAPVASPRLSLTRPDDLANHALIHFDWRVGAGATVPTWTKWVEAAGLPLADPRAGATFNDETSAILAAAAGQGVALLSLELVAAELGSGVLVQPFGPVLEGWRYDFVFPETAGERPAVLALRRWIEAEFVSGPEVEGHGRRRSDFAVGTGSG